MDRRERSRKLAASPLGWVSGDSPSPGRRSRDRRAAANARRFLQPSEPRPQPLAERWRFTVIGRVQGVGYRIACARQAQELHLGGWVRNCGDGSVQLEAEGPVLLLNDLRLWCERGPAGAQVHRVEATQVAPTGSDWFEVRA